MKNRKILIFIVIIVLLQIQVNADYSPAIGPDSELDLFMLRVSSKYGVKLPNSYYSKPMHVKDLMIFLDKCDSLSGVNNFTGKEIYNLKKIRHKYSGEMRLFGFDGKKIETSNYVNLDLLGDFDFYKPLFDKSHKTVAATRAKGVLGPQFSGNVKNISYFTEMNIWTDYMSDTTFDSPNYQPYTGINYNLYNREDKSNIRSSDLFRAGISYDGKRIDIETAVDFLREGPAVYYPLTLSLDYAPVTYFRARMDLELFNYTHTFGLLRAQKDKAKYFYFHRLGFNLFKKKVVFAINEAIVGGSTAELAQSDPLRKDFYGVERNWEWAYMIPFVPFKFAEHYVGDRDNGVLSVDIDIMLPTNFRWYGEFFIDDMLSPFKIFSNDYGNKWAYTVGAQFFGGREKFTDLTVTAEYSRIEPWVYTHFYGGSHSYTHFGQSMGSNMGPNSDVFVFVAEYGVSKKNTIGFKFENKRYNHNVRGGKITDVWLSPGNGGNDIETKEFLGENYTHSASIGITWKFSPFERFHYDSEFYIETINGIGFKINGGFSW